MLQRNGWRACRLCCISTSLHHSTCNPTNVFHWQDLHKIATSGGDVAFDRKYWMLQCAYFQLRSQKQDYSVFISLVGLLQRLLHYHGFPTFQADKASNVLCKIPPNFVRSKQRLPVENLLKDWVYLRCGKVPVTLSITQLQDRRIMAEGLDSAGRKHLRQCQSLGKRKTEQLNFPQYYFEGKQ